MQASYNYQQVLANSERVNWRVEDIIGGSKRLDFDRPFMPESLAPVRPLGFLTPNEQLVMNQIRGHGYLYLSRFANGTIAPMHLLDGLPDALVVSRAASGRALQAQGSVVAGFVRDGRFYSREEASRAVASDGGGLS